MVEIANRFTAKGHSVTIFHSDGGPCEWIECRASLKSLQAALDENHDILIYGDPRRATYRVATKARARKKVCIINSLPDPTDFLLSRYWRLYLRRDKRFFYLKKMFYSSHVKICVSSGLKRYLKENFNIDSELAVGGISTELFYPVATEKQAGKIRILYSGDPRANKNTKIVFEALEQVKLKEPRVILDSYHGLGIPQDRMAEKYSSADIFVDAQPHTGWNNPVAEAMACGVPVISTETLGGMDFVFNEKTALVVPFECPRAIEDAVMRLINDVRLRDKLRENACNQIRKFAWGKSIDKLEDILSNT